MSGRAATDRERCAEAIRQGSKSFHTASKILPRRIREPAYALYAFCRLADDWVDDGPATEDSVDRLQARLDEIYNGNPANHFVDRAFAGVVRQFDMPKCLPEGLIEGLRWDVEGRIYETLDDLLEYAARVAAAVGSMMTILMGERRQDVLARACDLGLAMQLTNIARDVGEDARNGRLYLPRSWLREEGLDPEDWLGSPVFNEAIGRTTLRLLDTAEEFYERSGPGIANLPMDCRPAIKAASIIYREIGRQLKRNGGNSVDQRTIVSKSRKLQLLGQALVTTPLIWQPPVKPPAPATEFLVKWSPVLERTNTYDKGLEVIGLLQKRDRARRRRQRSQLEGRAG